jgi:hypothetical protein
MDLFLLYLIGYGPLLLLFGAALFAAVATIGVGLVRPKYLVFAYLPVFLVFTQSTHGLREKALIVYGKAAGMLLFPLDHWILWGFTALAALSAAFSRKPPRECNLRPWIVAFVLLLLGHVATGIAVDVPIRESAGTLGIITVANMGILVLLILRTIDDRKDLDQLITIILLVLLGRGVFGVIRFLFFGGDPANVYEHNLDIGLKLTFFDICDLLLAAFAAFYCAQRLMNEGASLPRWQRWWFAAQVAIELFIIVFSFRRTALSGLVLAGLLFLALAPAAKRLAAVLLAIPVLAGGFLVLMVKRLSAESGGGGLSFATFFYDLLQGKRAGQESLRSLELRQAFQAFLDSPVFGQGSWGHFSGSRALSWQTGDSAFGFVHSGIVHLLFKSGLVGFAIVFAMAFGFIRFALGVRGRIEVRYRAVLDAAVATTLFMLPDIFFGTPFVQIRTTQLLGLCLALPYVAYAVTRISARETA